MNQYETSFFFDDAELIAKLHGNFVSLRCDEEHGAIMTLVNLMSGAGGNSTVASIAEAQATYDQLISGKGFLSEGFTVRKLSDKEIPQHEASRNFKE